MTQRQAPVLDRLINANVTTTSAGYAEYLFNDRADDPGGGTWQIDGQTVTIGRYDSRDQRVPDDLSLPLVGVVVESGGINATVRVTAWELVTGSYNLPAGWRLTVDGALPAAYATLALRLPVAAGVERTVSRKVWASRRDFTGRDLLERLRLTAPLYRGVVTLDRAGGRRDVDRRRHLRGRRRADVDGRRRRPARPWPFRRAHGQASDLTKAARQSAEGERAVNPPVPSPCGSTSSLEIRVSWAFQ